MGGHRELIDARRRRDVEHAAVRVLAEAHRLDDAAPQILEHVCSALEWDVGALWTSSRPSGPLRCAQLWYREDPNLASFAELCRQFSFPPGEGLPGRVWAEQKPIWVADVVVERNFPRAPAAEAAGLHGAFALPIFVRGEFYGVMEFFSSELREPDEDLLAMLTTIGVQLGDLIEWERLRGELEFQKALLESQGEAALDGILLVSVDQRVLYWNHRLVEMWGIPETVLARRDAFEVNTYMAPRAADPTIFDAIAEAVRENPALSRRDEIALRDGRVFDRWAAPVHGPDGSALGRTVFYRDITEQKLFEERMRGQQEWSDFLAEAQTLLSQTFDYVGALERLAQLAVPLLADWCVIHIVEEDETPRPVAVAHIDPDKVSEALDTQQRFPVDPAVSNGLMGVIRSRSPLLHSDIDDELLQKVARSDEHLEALRKSEMRSAMVVPLICRDRVLGTLSFVSAESGRRFGQADLDRAQELAARAAWPIDNARLYLESVAVGQTLQRSLLPPQLPDIPGVEIAARYFAAGEGAQVGGDFYDAFRIGRRAWGIVIGDVSGKGLDAATVTALARHTIRGAAMTADRPSEVLRILNTALLEQNQTDRFCTAVFAIVEPRWGKVRVTVSCGGHPAPYVIRRNGEVEPVDAGGTLLGFVEDVLLRDTTVELEFADKLFLCTDGVLDVRQKKRRFETEELERLLSECSTRGTEATADLIGRTVLDIQGGEARDDIAMILLGVRASIFRVQRRQPLEPDNGPTPDD